MTKRSKRSRRRSAAEDFAEIGPYVGHGITVVVAMLLFGGLGWWVDGKIGTLPLFLILGVFVGAAAAFYSVYQQVIVEPEKTESDTEEDGPE